MGDLCHRLQWAEGTYPPELNQVLSSHSLGSTL